MNYNTRKKIIKANLHISIKFPKKILKIKNKKELSKSSFISYKYL